MTIRRTDFWEVKPGRRGEFVEAFNDLKQAIGAHVDPIVRLMLVSHGQAGPPGLTTGHCLAVADFETGEAYGNFLDAASSDDAIQQIWSGLHSQTSPVAHRGTGLLHRFNEGGAPAPPATGSVTLVRAWKIAPGMDEVARAAGAVVNKHAEELGGHFQVMRPVTGLSGGPNAIVSHTFPNWAGLGQFLDRLNNDPEIQEVAASFRSATPTGQIVGTHIATTIAS